MAKFLAQFKHPSVKKIPQHLPHGISSKHGLKGFAWDKGQRAAMALGLGALKGHYREQLVWKGVGVEAIVGVAGWLGSALFGGVPVLERAGDTGMTAYLYAVGASWAADRAGYGVQATQAPKALPAGAGAQRRVAQGQQQVVGTIPPRSGGAFLTADEIANYSAPRH